MNMFYNVHIDGCANRVYIHIASLHFTDKFNAMNFKAAKSFRMVRMSVRYFLILKVLFLVHSYRSSF